MSHICQLSLTTGKLPSDWRNANITSIFKKVNKHTASRGWEEIFVKETMAPYLTTSRGHLENNVPFQISNRPQPLLVKLCGSLCIDKYHFLDLYGLCNMKKQIVKPRHPN